MLLPHDIITMPVQHQSFHPAIIHLFSLEGTIYDNASNATNMLSHNINSSETVANLVQIGGVDITPLWPSQPSTASVTDCRRGQGARRGRVAI